MLCLNAFLPFALEKSHQGFKLVFKFSLCPDYFRMECMWKACTWKGQVGTGRTPVWWKLSPCRWSVQSPPSTLNLWKTARRFPRVSCLSIYFFSWTIFFTIFIFLLMHVSVWFQCLQLGPSPFCLQVCTSVRVITSQYALEEPDGLRLWLVLSSNLAPSLQTTGSREELLYWWVWITKSSHISIISLLLWEFVD